MSAALKRIFLSGWEKFRRDKSSTSASLVIMVVVLSVAMTLFFVQGMSSYLIRALQESVDIAAYFSSTIAEEEIFSLRKELLSVPEVASVVYVSRDEALERFKARHKNDQVILDSLAAVGQNPLLASLNIKARQASQYASIAQFLEKSSYASLIDSVDYQERAPVIERLEKVSWGIKVGVFLLTALLALVALLIAYNTVRLTIYHSKDEIEVMKLVGAGNWFVRGPFLIQGMIVGVVSAAITLAVGIPTILLVSPRLESIMPGFNLMQYFFGHVLVLVLLLLALGIGLGTASSIVAIRRYLKV